MYSKSHILDINPSDLEQILIQYNYPAYRARQIYDWIFKNFVFDPNLMLNLPKDMRAKLGEIFSWNIPTIERYIQSEDQSCKILFKAIDNQYWESVLMFYPNRVTLCVSSQVGCRFACKFCQTGTLGFHRNLTTSEILLQYFQANNLLSSSSFNNCLLGKSSKLNKKVISNIVFMGMGEPLDNYDNIIRAYKFLTFPDYLNLSYNHVTISTLGLVPQIYKLAEENIKVSLAVSLNAADDDIRNHLMPINKKYPLSDLKEALKVYQRKTNQKITLEYVLISKINTDTNCMKKLLNFIDGLKVKINLIPYNYNPNCNYEPASEEEINNFYMFFKQKKYPITIRYSKGYDILGACGQLVNQLHYL